MGFIPQAGKQGWDDGNECVGRFHLKGAAREVGSFFLPLRSLLSPLEAKGPKDTKAGEKFLIQSSTDHRKAGNAAVAIRAKGGEINPCSVISQYKAARMGSCAVLLASQCFDKPTVDVIDSDL